VANQRQHAAGTQLDRATNRGGRRGILLAAAAAAFMFLVVVAVALTNAFVNYTSTDSFCGTTCHSMTWAAETYKRSPHFDNRFGVRVTCGDCHIPYDSNHPSPLHYVGLLLFKADRGAKDVWGELTKRIRTEEAWEKRRPQLAATVETFLKTHDSITCRGCHTLEAFSGPRNAMRQLVHRGVITADAVECLTCHAGIGHVVAGANPSSGGWYTPQQAADGALVYARACAMCHGAGLHGAGGPALVGQPFWHAYGGQRVSTLWSAVHTQMPMAAPGSVSVQDSIDIMAFLLQQNGVTSGATPLDDTVHLTNVLPPQ
jgi:cytochrome c-type protein NapC